MHEVVPKVVSIAVSTVITMLRILPQVLMLLNVPILFRLQITEYRVKAFRVQSTDC